MVRATTQAPRGGVRLIVRITDPATVTGTFPSIRGGFVTRGVHWAPNLSRSVRCCDDCATAASPGRPVSGRADVAVRVHQRVERRCAALLGCQRLDVIRGPERQQ